MMAIHYDIRRNLAVYSSLLLILILLFYNIVRSGLELQLNETLSTGGFVLFLLNFPILVVARLERKSARTFLYDEYFWLFILLVISFILGYANVRLPTLFMVLGTLCFILNAWDYIKAFGVREIASLLFVILLALWLAITIWDGDNLHPMLLERLATDDRIHIDTIFHVSIAQMIKTYSVPTTGLNGLPFYHYHFGSHMVMAYVSTLLDIGVFTFYQIGYPALFLPLFLKALLSLPVLWNERFAGYLPFKWSLWFGIALAAGIVGIFPLYKVLAPAGLEVSPLFTSESYGLSFLIVLLIFNFTLFNYRFDKLTQHYHLAAVPLVILFILIFFLGLTKNSSLFLFDVFIIYLFIRLRLYRQFLSWVLYALIGAISLACLYLTFDYNARDGAFAPFDFFKNQVELNPILFVVVYFFWSFVLVIACLILRYRQKVEGRRASAYLRTLVEATAVVSVLGALPALFFSIAGGSAHYFINFQMWLSLTFLLMILPAGEREIVQLLGNNAGLRRFRIYRAGLLIVCFYAVLIVVYNFRKATKTYTKHHLEDKQRVCGEVLTSGKNTILEQLAEIRSINLRVAECLDRKATYGALQSLQSLDTIPLAEKARTVLVWGNIDVLTKEYPCYKYPFFFPALTGMAIKDGFVYEDCYGENYSFEYYRKSDVHRNPLPDSTKMRQLVLDFVEGNMETSARDR